jgi:hypothetical protein
MSAPSDYGKIRAGKLVIIDVGNASKFRWRKLLARAWAAPCSALGLLFGLAMVLSGGRAQVRSGALEFGGGYWGRLVSRLPSPFGFSAIAFGHVVLGVDGATLDAVRAHEQVHVSQYERWGIFFLPAYLLSSLVQLARGRRPYLDNHFEREAYAQAAWPRRDR